jgi:long-subunit acyl-CoA synthetase (AMP-forming)
MEDATQLDWVYVHEKARPHDTWFTQPIGDGATRDLTFAQALGEARRMAAHLASHGFPPGSRIAIFSKNTAWWLIADFAIWMAGHVSVPVYPTLTAESIRKILEHAETSLIFVGKLDRYTEMEPGLPKHMPRVTMPLAPAEAEQRPDGERVPAWYDILASTDPIEGNPTRKPDDLATIIYTSGSTGEPKGTMHSFRTMCAACVFIDSLKMDKSDRMLSYLPLAHVAERACLETTTCKVGSHVFFSESLATFARDLRTARPTVFGSVPRLWQKLQEGVFTKMPPARLSRLLKLPVVRTAIARRVREGLGLDKSRHFITGSAPTPPELVVWFRGIGIEIGDIYGMTENFAVSHFTRPGEPSRAGWVGTSAPGVITRISEEGEVLVKSPGTMLGYYKNESLSRETLDAEGFLHTGDRGEIDTHGRLRINGRVKELFKTSKGKYVAPAPIEGALLAHPDVDQACVAGLGRPQPHALVVLSAAARGVVEKERAAFVAKLESHLDATNATFDQHERLDKLFIVPDEWSSENGFLTPTLKLRRAVIEERYADRVNALHDRQERVVWVSAN